MIKKEKLKNRSEGNFNKKKKIRVLDDVVVPLPRAARDKTTATQNGIFFFHYFRHILDETARSWPAENVEG